MKWQKNLRGIYDLSTAMVETDKEEESRGWNLAGKNIVNICSIILCFIITSSATKETISALQDKYNR